MGSIIKLNQLQKVLPMLMKPHKLKVLALRRTQNKKTRKLLAFTFFPDKKQIMMYVNLKVCKRI